MKKSVAFSLFIFAVVCIFNVSGCARKTAVDAPPPELRSKLVEISQKLDQARTEDADETWEYKEAERFFEEANELISQGDFSGAESALSQADIKITQALGAAREAVYMENFDEEAQKFYKQMLSDSFSEGNVRHIGLSDVFFEYDASELTFQTTEVLDRNIEILNENIDLIKNVLVFGFCDVRGTDEYNLALGKKRADMIKKYLIGRGIPAELVYSISRGETDIWGEGDFEGAYKANRRGHFIVLSNRGSS